MNTQEILDLINIKLDIYRDKRDFAETAELGQLLMYYDAKLEVLEQLKEQILIAEKNRKD